jgi:hypothetical protein
MTLFQEFAAWVAAQPPRRKIDFSSSTKDALAQFGRAHFSAPYSCGGVFTFTAGETAISAKVYCFDFPPHLVSMWADALIYSSNFGQLARRLTPIMEKINVQQ